MGMVNTAWAEVGEEVRNEARERDRSKLKCHPEGDDIARAAF